MEFYKYQGAGNDFIIIDGRKRGAFLSADEIRALCRRNTGIGADGIIFACHSTTGAEARMRLFNADGSEAEMSGNGIRCLAKYVYERQGIRKERMFLETEAGAKALELFVRGDSVYAVEVDMGMPEFAIETRGRRDEAGGINIELEGGEKIYGICLSMGNPHCVIFVDDVDSAEVDRLGPLIENHDLFPGRTNVGFAQTVDEARMKLRVWERGVGETAACGTGASAAFAAAVNTRRGATAMVVSQRGGDLQMRVGQAGHIFMKGPVAEVFRGELSGKWRDSVASEGQGRA
jgi:diaminopimelate epimerase